MTALLMIYIGIAGTGGFTNDQPLNQVPWLGVGIVIAITVALECVVFWAWHALKRLVDTAETR